MEIDEHGKNLKLCVSGGGGGNHFGGLESATPRMLGGGEWRHGGVWGESAFRPSGGDF